MTGAREGATHQAEAAAAASGVQIRTVHEVDELRGVIELFDEVWSTSGAPPIGLEHLIALAHAGSYVGGAYDGAELLGASVAFLATPIGEVLHSDVTGVVPRARERRLGFALKLHQRAWALDNGLSRITWTFDPLIRRNAYFNLVKLGAGVSAYLVDFYGDMPDPVNAGQGSDRLLASWQLTDPVVDEACGGRPRTAPRGIGAQLLTVGGDQEPVIAGAEVVDDLFVRLGVPADIEGLRRTDPNLARTWRQVIRDSLGRELMSGARIAGFDPESGYLIEERRCVRLDQLELLTVELPLIHPFRTSFGTEYTKEALLVHAFTDAGEGWGECVASPEPLYSSEYNAASVDVIRRFLAPPLFAAQDLRADDVAGILAPIKGHRMSKAAIEMAILDAELRSRQVSLGERLGAVVDRVPSGVSVGILDSIPQLIDHVGGYLDEGYMRIKLKIEPGWDVDACAAVRDQFGAIPLQVDANTAYTLADADHLAKLDDFDLLLIEQPLGEEDIRQHAELARMIKTPVCLDESVMSLDHAADAIALQACKVINIKPGRVGGYLEAVRIHDLARANGMAVWCGGMVETGLGRAANAALAALPGFTLPGDVSGSDRFFAEDITEPIVMHDGYVDVPSRPGLGVEPVPEQLARFTTWTETLTP